MATSRNGTVSHCDRQAGCGDKYVPGPRPSGFTQAAARTLAALLGTGPLPVGLKVASIRVLGPAAA
jgi:hypothetical protein